MATFTDDFERANGPLGASWWQPFTWVKVSAGRAIADVASVARPVSIADAGPHDATIAYPYSVASDLQNRVIVKGNDGLSAYYYARLNQIGGQWLGEIHIVNPSDTTLTSSAIPTIGAGEVTLRLTYSSGVLSLYVNGALRAQAFDSVLASNTRVGMFVYQSVAGISSFTTSTPGIAGLLVTPSSIAVDAGVVLLSLFGTNTGWTPGTPGSPIFTSSTGLLSSQAILSPSTATVYFTPPADVGSSVITDPLNGLTATLAITAAGTGVSGGQFAPRLTPAGAESINAPAALFEGAKNITDLTTTIPAAMPYPAADIGFLTAINHIYAAVVLQQAVPPLNLPSMADVMRVLNNNVPLIPDPKPDQILQPLNYTLSDMYQLWYNDVSMSYWKVDEVIAALKGLDNRSITQVYDLVDALQTGSNQDVLDALAALQTYLGTEHSAIAGLIGDLATPAGYTLGSVLDAISNIQSGAVDLTPVLTAISNLRGGNATVQAVRDLLATMDDKIDAIRTDVTAIRTAGNLTLQSVLDAIAAIEIPPAAAYDGPPVWPGQSNVTLGAPSALADDLVLTGPMHGILLTITGHPTFAQKYKFGPVDSWSRVGAVVFRSEQGSYERSQSFSLDTQVMVPATMKEAASSAFRVNAGWEGTVRTWHRNA